MSLKDLPLSIAPNPSSGSGSGSASASAFGDMTASLAPLMMFLNQVHGNTLVIDALSSPSRPCLSQDAPQGDPAWSRQNLETLVEMHMFELDAINIAGLTSEQKLALRLYTIETPVKIYEVVNEGYKSTSRNPHLLRNSGPFSKILIQSIRALSKVCICTFIVTHFDLFESFHKCNKTRLKLLEN